MKVYLLGAANPETIRMIYAVQRSTPNVEIVGFLDNDPNKKNKDFFGFPILGGIELVKELAKNDVGFVNLITGDTRTRYETTCEILEMGGRLTNLIHPSIDLTMCKLGVGLYLQESVIVQAADAVSASRPGARRDTLENYLKRLEELENIANSFEGVEKSYAIQAGREIRVFVTPEKVSDLEAKNMARDIAEKIEREVRYPGEIKVHVIRESRVVEYAR